MAALVGGAGCRESPPRSAEGAGEPPRIAILPADDGGGAVDVLLSDEDAAWFRAADLSHEDWVAVLRVVVAADDVDPADQPSVLGRYRVTDTGIRFTPRYPFDPGRSYHVTFDPARLPVGSDPPSLPADRAEATVSLPAREQAPTTQVLQVYPTSPVIPENHLRFYIEFSAPMGLAGGRDHVRLLDADGGLVEDAFLPLDVAMWNDDRTRYTVLFDPGRVKRGILPNEQMGRPLVEGRRYVLVVDAAWSDGNGLPLVAPHRHEFTVGPPLERAIDAARWELTVPPADTRAPLEVRFDRALDYALLHRALVVASPDGQPLRGDIEVGAGETSWRFVPDDPWTNDEHALIARTMLEDPSGNRIGRAFEVGPGDASPRPASTAPFALPFLPPAR